MNCYICHRKFHRYSNKSLNLIFACQKHETFIIHEFEQEILHCIKFALPEPYEYYHFTYLVKDNFLQIKHHGLIFYRGAAPSTFAYETAPYLLKRLTHLKAFL